MRSDFTDWTCSRRPRVSSRESSPWTAFARALVATIVAAIGVTVPPTGTAYGAPLPTSDAGRTRFTDDLLARVAAASNDEFVPVIVTLEPRIELESLELELASRGIETRWKRHRFVIDRARELAATSQVALRSYLEDGEARGDVRDVHPYWVTNAIAFSARPALLARMADARASLGLSASERDAFGTISRLHLDGPVYLKEGTQESAPVGSSLERAAGEPSHNLVAIHAPEAWARGLTGAGRLVGHFDAGVEGTSVSFADRWRGVREDVPWQEAWFDPYTQTEFPYGVDQGHGTGTLGVLLGTQPEGPPIGVAYEAEWIAAGVVIQYNEAKILQAFEWAADPDGDSSTIDDVPDVINHSWGTFGGCTTEYWDAIDLCEAAGIVNVIAVDNSGPSPGSVHSPESRATSPYENFSVGRVSTDEAEITVYQTSGRGPSPCDGTSIKPELAGPGTRVPGVGSRDNFDIVWSGTSFAAPHVSGVVALLRQLDPSLTVREIKHALMVTAQDLGDPGEDNDTGWGLVDADAAATWVERNISPSPPPYVALGAEDEASVALLRWAPPRYLGRGEVPDLVGYRIYRAADGDPFEETPTFEVGPFPTELWDRTAAGVQNYVVTAMYDDGSESEPTSPVRIQVATTEPPDRPGALEDGDRARLVVVPNPFSNETEIRLTGVPDASQYLEIWSADGRRIRVLRVESATSESQDAGRTPIAGTEGVQTFHWDGTDHRGRSVAAGVYFGRLSGAHAADQGDGPDPVRILRLD